MSRDIDISLLRSFVAVVDTGSVTAAARLLNRTQAAVSLQIKRLEELLNQQLFARQHRKLVLTQAGERLLTAAQRIVNLNDVMVGEMMGREFEGEVRFGIPADIVRTYIPPILRRFHGSCPRVRMSLHAGISAELVRAYQNGDLDIVLTTDLRPGENAETLRRDRLVWISAPDASAHRMDPLPLAIGDNNCRFRPVALDVLREAGKDWRLVLEATRQVAQEAVVSAGIAVSVALRDSVPEGFVVLGPDSGLPPLPDFHIDMYAPPRGSKPVVDELAGLIRSEFEARYGSATAPTISPNDGATRSLKVA